MTTYSTRWDNLKKVLGKHWHLLMLDNDPNLIAKRAPTIGDTLVHSEYTRGGAKTRPTLSFAAHIPGMHPCGHCTVCKFVKKTNIFKDSAGKQMYKIKPFVNCSTTYVILNDVPMWEYICGGRQLENG